MPRSPRPRLTLLVPPPFHQTHYSPIYAYNPSPLTGPSPKTLSPSSTTTTLTALASPAGTIIFDSTNLYTPTSPAKPFIYASYLPNDETSLSKLLRAERAAEYERIRHKLIVLFWWLVGVCVIVGFWGWSSWCGRFSYKDSGVFDTLFGNLLRKHHNSHHSKEFYTRPPEVRMNATGTGYSIYMPPAEEIYPLSAQMYRELCDAVDMKSMMAFEARNGRVMAAHTGYFDVDVGYEGLESDWDEEWDGGDEDEAALGGVAACEKTLTYVVDDWEGRVGGVGEVVMGMWMAYGVAVREGREFFVVQGEGRWAYGDIRRYFNIPPPSKNCLPPPMSRRLPCPRTTEHKLVTPSTFKDSFGHVFENEFEDARAMGVMRQKPIFEFLRTGFEAIPLKEGIQSTITDRVNAIGITSEKDVVAVQIRRGDRNAREWRYHNGYIPLDRYMKVSHNENGTVAGGMFLTGSGEDGEDVWPKKYSLPSFPECGDRPDEPIRVIASDASDIFDTEEIKNCDGDCVRAQDRSVSVGKPGGFWAEDIVKMDAEIKEAEGVATDYLIDFGVLIESVTRARDGWVVCGYYGDMCRMLAVGLGWESAIQKGHWVNIDGDFDWFGMRW
ncbi:hypothetical protein ABW20_dc0103078 [Dactylellina cionopaga]|nr:hypothetical protein ABW20_dc0103078 [Dactylellina cionopaga]